MDFGQKLKRFVELKKLYNSTPNFNSSEYEILEEYFSKTYMQLRLRNAIDPKNYSFGSWIEKEYKQLVEIEELLGGSEAILNSNSPYESELELHMESFDNLNFSNPKVYNWHKSILEALENDRYEMSTFYFTGENKNNKTLMEGIALKGETYNFLNSKGLINTGICPISGEKTNNTINYNIYGRKVYLSQIGLEVCNKIDRNEWNKEKHSVDYDTFQDLKQQTRKKTKSQVQLITLIILVLALTASWVILSPSGFFSFLGFICLSVVFLYVFAWLFNLIFDMFYK